MRRAQQLRGAAGVCDRLRKAVHEDIVIAQTMHFGKFHNDTSRLLHHDLDDLLIGLPHAVVAQHTDVADSVLQAGYETQVFIGDKIGQRKE